MDSGFLLMGSGKAVQSKESCPESFPTWVMTWGVLSLLRV